MDPQLDLRVLRYFVAVAEELHFGRAAARLHISQPSLSVQVRNLEHSLGTPLLVRTSRGAVLTAAGEVLLEESKALLHAAQRAVALTKEAAAGQRMVLTVGFQANAAAELTPKILASFRRDYPKAQIRMRSHDFADPTAGLSDGACDVAFVRPPLPQDRAIAAQPLFTEPRVLVTPAASQLAALETVDLEQVLDEPFVARKAPEAWRDFWLAAQAREGAQVRLGADVATVDECFEAILAERGIAFTQASTRRFYDRPGLSFIPVTGVPPTSLCIAWRTDTSNPLARHFVETAMAIAATEHVPETLELDALPARVA